MGSFGMLVGFYNQNCDNSFYNYNILLNNINNERLKNMFGVDIIQRYRKDGNLYDGC